MIFSYVGLLYYIIKYAFKSKGLLLSLHEISILILCSLETIHVASEEPMEANNKGKIEIEYYSMDDFERIVELIESIH